MERNEKRDIGIDGRKCHIWKFGEKEVDFEDIIVVSDEVPRVLEDGKSFTLWTKAHEENQLFIEDEKSMLSLHSSKDYLLILHIVDVQQISFTWDLSMSEKLSPTGDFLGAYSLKDLQDFYIHPQKRKGPKGRQHFRRLEYDLVWHITEMQVKVHVKPIFPRAIGPPTMQLAKQKSISASERWAGESRSVGLQRDITISAAIESPPTVPRSPVESPPDLERGTPRTSTGTPMDLDDDFLGGGDLVEELAREHPHRRALRSRSPNCDSPVRTPNPAVTGTTIATNSWRMVELSSSSSATGSHVQDGRRREGSPPFQNCARAIHVTYSHSDKQRLTKI